MKVANQPIQAPKTLKSNSNPQGPEAPKDPEEPKERFSPSPRPSRESRYAPQRVLARVASGALEGFLAHQFAGESQLLGAAIGAGTGAVTYGLVKGIETSKAAKIDGFPILGFGMGAALGGLEGASRGAGHGFVAVGLASATGTGALGATVMGALMGIL